MALPGTIGRALGVLTALFLLSGMVPGDDPAESASSKKALE
jgi:hypothetical protein